MFCSRSNKPKIKLYRDSNGIPKGDALCTYAKVESVQLAFTILDGSTYHGKVGPVIFITFMLCCNSFFSKRKSIAFDFGHYRYIYYIYGKNGLLQEVARLMK